jgi:hypothetical protein
MTAGCRELVAAYEATVITKHLLDAIVVQGFQGDGRLAHSTDADQSDWREGFGETDHRFDQFVTPETGPWWGWR